MLLCYEFKKNMHLILIILLTTIFYKYSCKSLKNIVPNTHISEATSVSNNLYYYLIFNDSNEFKGFYFNFYNEYNSFNMYIKIVEAYTLSNNLYQDLSIENDNKNINNEKYFKYIPSNLNYDYKFNLLNKYCVSIDKNYINLKKNINYILFVNLDFYNNFSNFNTENSNNNFNNKYSFNFDFRINKIDSILSINDYKNLNDSVKVETYFNIDKLITKCYIIDFTNFNIDNSKQHNINLLIIKDINEILFIYKELGNHINYKNTTDIKFKSDNIHTIDSKYYSDTYILENKSMLICLKSFFFNKIKLNIFINTNNELKNKKDYFLDIISLNYNKDKFVHLINQNTKFFVYKIDNILDNVKSASLLINLICIKGRVNLIFKYKILPFSLNINSSQIDNFNKLYDLKVTNTFNNYVFINLDDILDLKHSIIIVAKLEALDNEITIYANVKYNTELKINNLYNKEYTMNNYKSLDYEQPYFIKNIKFDRVDHDFNFQYIFKNKQYIIFNLYIEENNRNHLILKILNNYITNQFSRYNINIYYSLKEIYLYEETLNNVNIQKITYNNNNQKDLIYINLSKLILLKSSCLSILISFDFKDIINSKSSNIVTKSILEKPNTYGLFNINFYNIKNQITNKIQNNSNNLSMQRFNYNVYGHKTLSLVKSINDIYFTFFLENLLNRIQNDLNDLNYFNQNIINRCFVKIYFKFYNEEIDFYKYNIDNTDIDFAYIVENYDFKYFCLNNVYNNYFYFISEDLYKFVKYSNINNNILNFHYFIQIILDNQLDTVLINNNDSKDIDILFKYTYKKINYSSSLYYNDSILLNILNKQSILIEIEDFSYYINNIYGKIVIDMISANSFNSETKIIIFNYELEKNSKNIILENSLNSYLQKNNNIILKWSYQIVLDLIEIKNKIKLHNNKKSSYNSVYYIEIINHNNRNNLCILSLNYIDSKFNNLPKFNVENKYDNSFNINTNKYFTANVEYVDENALYYNLILNIDINQIIDYSINSYDINRLNNLTLIGIVTNTIEFDKFNTFDLLINYKNLIYINNLKFLQVLLAKDQINNHTKMNYLSNKININKSTLIDLNNINMTFIIFNSNYSIIFEFKSYSINITKLKKDKYKELKINNNFTYLYIIASILLVFIIVAIIYIIRLKLLYKNKKLDFEFRNDKDFVRIEEKSTTINDKIHPNINLFGNNNNDSISINNNNSYNICNNIN